MSTDSDNSNDDNTVNNIICPNCGECIKTKVAINDDDLACGKYKSYIKCEDTLKVYRRIKINKDKYNDVPMHLRYYGINGNSIEDNDEIMIIDKYNDHTELWPIKYYVKDDTRIILSYDNVNSYIDYDVPWYSYSIEIYNLLNSIDCIVLTCNSRTKNNGYFELLFFNNYQYVSAWNVPYKDIPRALSYDLKKFVHNTDDNTINIEFETYDLANYEKINVNFYESTINILTFVNFFVYFHKN